MSTKKPAKFSVDNLESSFLQRQNEAQIEDGIGRLIQEEQQGGVVAEPIEKPSKESTTRQASTPKPKKQEKGKKDTASNEPSAIELPTGQTIGVQVPVPIEVYQRMEQFRMTHISQRWTKQKMGLSAILEWVDKYCNG